MKTFQILAFGAILSTAVAQTLDSLPECGKTCVNNMLQKASELGCSPADVACLCGNIDFAYGIRDCSTQSCGSAQAAAPVISYGERYCSSSSGSSLGSGGSNNNSSSVPTQTSSAGASTSTGVVIIVTSGTEVFTSTVTSAPASSITSVASSIASSASSASASLSSQLSSVSSAASSASQSATATSSSSGARQTAFAGLAAAAGLAGLLL